jgi:predicted RecB family nuclease
MMKKLADKMFYKYLRCPHWVYWDIYGEKKDAEEASELMEKIREHSVLNKEEYLGAFGKVETIPSGGDEDENFIRTLELMKAGSAAVFRGCLMDGNWIGTPDLLAKMSTPPGVVSRFGDWIYEPYVIKSAIVSEEKDIRDEYRFELAFYALILEKLQGFRPENGYVIAADKTIHGVRINNVLNDFHLTLKEIESIINGRKPAPFLSSSCKESPWFASCVNEAETCDDICLIYKIRRADHAKLYEAGIKTVGELAGTDLDTLVEAVPEMSRRKLEMLRRQAIALRDGKTITIQKPSFLEVFPEYYFDIEGDPLRNVHYLFGLLGVKGARAKGAYEYVLAEGPEGEKDAWLGFLDLVKKIPAGSPIYHYGTYEKTVVDIFGKKYGGNAGTLSKLEKNLTNLLPIVCETAALPVYFYSLKDIAKEMGFKWRHKQASGVNSIVWYEDYLRLKASGKKRDLAKAKKILTDIVAYNEDDVRATLFLKRRLGHLPEPETV